MIWKSRPVSNENYRIRMAWMWNLFSNSIFEENDFVKTMAQHVNKVATGVPQCILGR